MHTHPTHRRGGKTKDISTIERIETTSTPKGRNTNSAFSFSRFIDANTRNMKDNHKKKRLRLKSSKLLRWTCILFPCTILLSLIWSRSQQYTYDLTTEEERCWLKEQFQSGDFFVGSHRSLGDSHLETQPDCLEGLMQLNVNGIHYLDLDLIWDPSQNTVVVAHPMEFQGTTDFYSPCAKLPLLEVIQKLQMAMPKFMVSLEPKADWDRTNGYHSMLKEPVLLLKEIIRVLQLANLKPEQCSLIVDAKKGERNEDALLEQLANYCNLMFPVRFSEGYDAQMAIEERNYEYLAPTIEFHPSHPNHLATIGWEGLQRAQKQVPKSIYWIVDTPQDLERVALLKATGLISNRPLEMVKILKDKRYGWCTSRTSVASSTSGRHLRKKGR